MLILMMWQYTCQNIEKFFACDNRTTCPVRPTNQRQTPGTFFPRQLHEEKASEYQNPGSPFRLVEANLSNPVPFSSALVFSITLANGGEIMVVVDAGHSGSRFSGVAAFEMEYGHWVDEQNRQISELRTALQAQISDIELRFLVDGGMGHYFELFSMKSKAAKADVFYVMSGMWKTSAERFFSWIGGFRPSELLQVLLPQLYLADQQVLDVGSLRQSCQQAEEALSQGMDKLQRTLATAVAADPSAEGIYDPPMAIAMEKLEALVEFVNQADHLRKETLQQMSRILTIRQAARGLLALGEYFQRLRALSSLWTTRPREPT